MTEPVYETTTERLYARLPDVLRKSDRVVNYNLKTFLSALGDIQSDVDLLHARFNYQHPEDRVGPNDMMEPNTTYSYPERVRTKNSEGFLSDQIESVRKNLIPDPRYIGLDGKQGGGAASWEQEDLSTGGPYGGGWTRVTANAVQTGVVDIGTDADGDFDVIPDETYTCSLHVFAEQSIYAFYTYISWRRADGTQISTSGGTSLLNPPVGKWHRRSQSAIAPAGATHAQIRARLSYSADIPLKPGESVGVACRMAEIGDILKPYFDGDTKYEDEVRIESKWDGSRNGSTSTETTYVVQDRVLNGLRSDLVDARYADEDWLPWIAQLLGADITHLQSEEEVRNLLTSPAVFEAGSYNSIYNAVKSQLSGTQYMKLYRNTTDVLHPGEATEWDILIVTKNSETPEFSQILDAVERNQARPAGVRLYHDTYESSWQAVEVAYPTWAEWEGATWEEIEETGLS